MGVVFNNTVVPGLGWDAMFIILGSFSVISFIMLLSFKPVKSVLLPFDDEAQNEYLKEEKVRYAKDRKRIIRSAQKGGNSKLNQSKDSGASSHDGGYSRDESSDAETACNPFKEERQGLKTPLLFVDDK